MFCPHCGASTSDNASFCPKCGKPIPENPTQDEDERSSNSPRGASASSSSTRVLVIVAVVLVVAVIGLIIYLLRAPSAPSTTAKSDQPGNEETVTQEKPSQTTEGQDSQQKKADDTAAQKLEDDKHQQLRAEAQAKGLEVFEGTVKIMSLRDLLISRGIPENQLMGEVAGTEAVLVLDEPFSRAVPSSIGGTASTTYDIDVLVLGGDHLSQLSPYEPWTEYDGKHVCAAGTLVADLGQMLMVQLHDSECLYEL